MGKAELTGVAHTQFDASNPKFRGLLKSTSWTLSVGAGICEGLMPSWGELSRRILNRTFSLSLPPAEFEGIVRRSGWGFDAWIQAALNKFIERGGDPESFSVLVEQELYGDLRRMAEAAGIEKLLVAAFNTPQLLRKDEFDSVYEFVAGLGMSAVTTADLLLESMSKGCAPRAIITFNYDTILETIIRMQQIKRHSERVGRHEFPPASFTRVTGPSTPAAGVVPIYHVHGCVVPQSGRRRSRTPHDTRDRIVGPESSYLSLAGAPWAWAQTTFLYRAQRDSLVFLGQSMGDPNLRRWLAWASTVRNGESARVAGGLALERVGPSRR